MAIVEGNTRHPGKLFDCPRCGAVVRYWKEDVEKTFGLADQGAVTPRYRVICPACKKYNGVLSWEDPIRQD